MGSGYDPMIYQLTNALLIPKVMGLVREYPEFNDRALEPMLIEAIGRKDARIFVDEKEGVVNGFILATSEFFEGEDSSFIQACIVRPNLNEKNVCNELLSQVRKWCREHGLKTMYFMTPRSHRAYQRKYKFRFHAVVLKRSVDDEPIQKQKIERAHRAAV